MHFTSSTGELRLGLVSGHKEPSCHIPQNSCQCRKVWEHMLREGLDVEETGMSETWPVLRRKGEKEQDIKVRLQGRR